MAQHKVLLLEIIQAGRFTPAETDDLGNYRKKGRGAAGGKILDGRTKNGKFDLWQDENENLRSSDRNLDADRINLAVRKHRDRAFVVGLARVVVNQLMQRGAHRHRVQKEHQRDQDRGENRLAVTLELTGGKPHPSCF